MTATENAEAIGAPAYESIASMVAALQCDYDRLEEIKSEREDWEGDNPNAAQPWTTEHAEESAELLELLDEADGCQDEEEAREKITDDALEITVRGERRSGKWIADEFIILLTTGGPAVRITGECFSFE